MKTHKQHKKRHCFRWFLLGILLFGIWFWYFQNFTFTVTNTTISSGKVSSPLTIVQITDLHGAKFGKENKKLVASIRKQNPDLICSTGDMYTNGDTQGMDTAVSLLKQLTEIAPVYCVPGEHDQDETFLATLSAAGVHVMSYKKESLEIRDNTVTIYGIDNVYYTNTFNLFREFDKPSSDSYNILLAHIPNFEAFNWFGPDISLCGDTHGGLVQIPFLGPLYFNGEWLPELKQGEEYVTDKGLFDTYTGHVYVSGGLGNYPYPLRMFNRPEVSVLTIMPPEEQS